MRNKILIFTIFAIIGSHYSTFAQNAMGSWRTHFAYNSVNKITQSPNKIYAVSDGILFSIDKKTHDIEEYSKLTGLNGVIVSQLKYDEKNNQLIICYNNGNIDIMTSQGIINIPDFYNKVMNVNKDVNHIEIYQDRAYLSCNFGIIVLDLKKKEIADTYYIGPNASLVNVTHIAVQEDHMYALTYVENTSKTYTLYRASLANPASLVNYENWFPMSGLPGTGSDLKGMVSFNGSLFLVSDNLLYQQDGNSWKKFMDDKITDISTSHDRLFATSDIHLLAVVHPSLAIQRTVAPDYLHQGIYDIPNRKFWFAASAEGIIPFNSDSPSLDSEPGIKPIGPAVNTHWRLKMDGEKLFSTAGGRGNSAQLSREGCIMIYEDGEWINIKGEDISKEANNTPVLDFMDIAIDPLDNSHFFITSYGTGLYEFRENKFYKKYDYSNSPIQPIVDPKDKYMRLEGIVFDKEGNLFFTNAQTTGLFKVFTKAGDWITLKTPFNALPYLTGMHISTLNQNQKWVLAERQTPGLIVFDDEGTLSNSKNIKTIFFNRFSDSDKPGEYITPKYYYSIAQDHNGVIWVGTDIGPILFNNLSKVFDSGYTCSRIKIPRNDGSGHADYLLAEEAVNAIAIDGANRKWLGTQNSGVYLMSENGQETIFHFTSENSPLLSNTVTSITINPVSGEVFFATSNGLISYQSDAAAAGNTFDNAHAYPNPVRENFTGVITIAGLMDETQVKITDLNGNLICETTSNGSLATWDGKDASGRKVNTGVYLALCVSKDGKDSAIVKILFIN